MSTPSSDQFDRILTSLDKAQRVPAPPYFYTRLRARLDQPKPLEQAVLLWVRPLPIVVLLVILLLLNFWLINSPLVDPAVATHPTKSASEDELHVIAFEERSSDQMVADYEATIDPTQK